MRLVRGFRVYTWWAGRLHHHASNPIGAHTPSVGHLLVTSLRTERTVGEVDKRMGLRHFRVGTVGTRHNPSRRSVLNDLQQSNDFLRHSLHDTRHPLAYNQAREFRRAAFGGESPDRIPWCYVRVPRRKSCAIQMWSKISFLGVNVSPRHTSSAALHRQRTPPPAVPPAIAVNPKP